MKRTQVSTIDQLDFERHDWRDISEFLRPCKAYKKGRTGIEYLNISTSFDIESTSFFRHKETGEIIDTKKAQGIPDNELRKKWEKVTIMYAWVFCIYGHAFVGRTWEEFKELTSLLIDYFELNEKKILVVGVHNLAYEFQFIRKRFAWSNVFAVRDRTPIYARTESGIEFRCTLLLSGYSLAKVGEHLQSYKIKKKVGDLDYLKLRHSQTPLTDEEWGYIVNDGLIVWAYLQELIDKYKRIVWLPMTKTGFV